MLSSVPCSDSKQPMVSLAKTQTHVSLCVRGFLITPTATAVPELQNSECFERAADAVTIVSELRSVGPCCFQNGLQHVVCTSGDMEMQNTACAVWCVAKTGDITKREHWPNFKMYGVTVAGTTSSLLRSSEVTHTSNRQQDNWQTF